MKKIFVIVFLILLSMGTIIVYQYTGFYDDKLHIVVCDVGQGDGIFIRTPKRLNLIIDSGPDNSMLSCLSKHMPFWDKTFHIAFLTHPHTDHFAGFNSIVKRYNVLSFDTERLENKAVGFEELMKIIKNKKIPIRYLYSGDSFKTKEGVGISLLGPTSEFLQQTSPNGVIGESKEFASLITLISYGSFNAVFTGDSQASELEDALSKMRGITSISVLQVPHHGSKTGLSKEILEMIRPKLAVVSVGSKNRYGHPAPFTLDLLSQFKIKILRTDQDGDIKIISDGVGWKAK